MVRADQVTLLHSLRSAVATAFIFAVALGPSQQASAAASTEEVDAALENVFNAGDYQRELPLRKVSKGQEDTDAGDDEMSDPNWWRNEDGAQAPDYYRPRAPEREDSGFKLDLPPALLEVLRVLMWVVFFAGGALLAYYLLNEFRLFSRWKKGDWQKEGESGGAAGGRSKGAAMLEDFEALAAKGDYAEAVHVLLLRSILLIRDRGAALSAALTSREILRHAPLADQEKDAFSKLVRVTELTHFGGRGATEDDFLQCRDLFQRIARGSAGGAA